jgi:putative PD-(D/E)XK family protein DUF4420
MSDLRSVVADHWAALDGTSKGSSWLTAALPVEAAEASVLCAVGPDNKRHLLVPVPPGAVVQADLRAGAVHLLPLRLQADTVTRNYVDLVLLRSDLADIFTGLCADMIAALAADAKDPLAIVTHVLDGWHDLFRSGRMLGIEQLAGLFGELTFLNLLLDLNVDLLGVWQGPMRSPHDFVANGRAVEVKATAATEGRSVRIHGLNQLLPPEGGLMLRWMRLDTSNVGGTSLPRLVDLISQRVGRPRELWQLLARSGYLLADREHYGGILFTVVEEAAYLVTTEFPRIVPSSFENGAPAGVSNVAYTVDLDLVPAPMQKSEIEEFMNAMAAR